MHESALHDESEESRDVAIGSGSTSPSQCALAADRGTDIHAPRLRESARDTEKSGERGYPAPRARWGPAKGVFVSGKAIAQDVGCSTSQ